MKAMFSYNKNAFLNNGTPVPFNVRYSHPELGPCSEFYCTKDKAEQRIDELNRLLGKE